MMNSSADINRDPLDQACAWIARLRAENAGNADWQAFAGWLGKDPANADAYDRMLELWHDLGILRVLPIETPALAETGSPARWRIPLALAASLVAVLFLLPLATTQQALELRTTVGGFDQVRLEDGSELTLNTDTSLEVRMDSSSRVVHMARGEAFFEIAPDADRPFRAICGKAAVTVLGTAFNASCSDDAMSVLVERGAVRFGAWPANGDTQLMQAGDMAHFDPHTGLAVLEATDLHARLAWRRQQVVFDDLRLESVISELQRYMKPTLRVVDAQAAAMRVSGVFSTSEPLLTLRALESSLGLSIEGPAQGPLLISLRDSEL